jgi:hypothetical protein
VTEVVKKVFLKGVSCLGVNELSVILANLLDTSLDTVSQGVTLDHKNPR